MASQITNYKCPACTGPLHFVGASGKLECDFCGGKYDVAEIEALQRRLEQNKAQLLVAIESIENKPDGLQCTENTQRVLERLREEGPPQTVGRPRQTRSRGSSPTPAEQRLSDA